MTMGSDTLHHGRISIADMGGATDPVLSFDSVSRTGFYVAATPLLGITVSGSLKLSITTNQYAMFGTGGWVIQGTGDVDLTFMQANVDGTPQINWDESEDQFELTHGLRITGTFRALNFVNSDVVLQRAGTQKLRLAASLCTINDDALFNNDVAIMGDVGFYGTAPVAQQTGVAVTAAAIHAALVTLGLITA